MRMDNTIKLNMEETWFESLLVELVTTWEELVEAYMNKFFLQPRLLKREEKS